MTMNCKHLKAGDQVYLIEQANRSRSSTACYTEVVKVGKKYGYILRHGRQAPFDLLTGQSVHNDSNARWNSQGFDVWPSKESYDEHIAKLEERQRLSTRIASLSHGQYRPRLDHASPELVADLHAALDRHVVQ
jgi:hypothetical protein